MIYIGGDSWSWETPNYRTRGWPSIVADKIGVSKLVNDSVGCGGNSRILSCLENFYITSTEQPTAVILALSHHARWHLPAANFGSWHILPQSTGLKSEHTGEEDKILENFFYKKAYNEVDSVFRYYKIVWSLSNLCKQLKCPYMIFQAWDFELSRLDILKNTDSIKKFVYTYYRTSDIHANRYIKGFEFFSQQKHSWNYIEKPLSHLLTEQDFDHTQHPNDRGHQLIADYIYNTLDKTEILK